ncbi:MAG TPA: hypothetical protein ENH29_07515 [Bacteroidetes bacterium]|nr:hypothetical protein [Bacteroidota bacterium]
MTDNRKTRSFTMLFILLSLAALPVGFLSFYLFRQGEYLTVLSLAWGISFVVILSGYLANTWAFNRSHKTFFMVLLGGMAFRVILIIGIILIVYFKNWVPILEFLILLAIYYFLFQLIEVWLINRRLKNQKKADITE